MHTVFAVSRRASRAGARVAAHSRLIDALLVTVALIWGTSYGVVKGALLIYPVLGLLALRFGITCVVLSPALRVLVSLPRAAIARVVGASLLMLGIFLAETFGVSLTHASNAAFLISLCVVLTPLIEWAWLKRAPRPIEWIAAGLSLFGALLLGGGFAFTPGDGLMVLAAALRALSACASKRVMKANAVPPLTLTAAQACIVSLGCIVLGLALAHGSGHGHGHGHWPPLPGWTGHGAFWGSIAYLVVGCTVFAFFVQNYAVSRSSPTRVALLMGSEPMFGALFACLWLGERMSVIGWIGGTLIVVASLLAVGFERTVSANGTRDARDESDARRRVAA
ncbi:DMT family transporter [Pararobbsia silviterrae]|uniref:DMT family transporter n=1 Tax=Pararobbsia silviterrae TaxID=1792498 RepID=A0A494Y735_9BURK|nr:DMT family transporter [Pararobbsia silviterrae]RKP57892.1 DMT family transporter [Pararobbsia silviterrae]